jgi:hypothetical protein
MNKGISKYVTELWNGGSRQIVDLFDTIPQIEARVRYQSSEYKVTFIVYEFDRNVIIISCQHV